MGRPKQELFSLEGTVLRKFPSENGATNGKSWVRNKFILKTLDGRDLYVTKFGQFSAEFIGRDVKFQASKYNETNYTVQGEIEDAGDLVGAAVETAPQGSTEAGSQPVATKRRGRPSKRTVDEAVVDAVKHTNNTQEQTQPVNPLTSEAEVIVEGNLKRAENLLIRLLRRDYTTADIVAVGDMLGRTYVSLRIEQNKDRRTSEINRR